MLRISCCQICSCLQTSGRRTFSSSSAKWKTWSSSSRIATKPVAEEEQLVQQIDLSALKNSAENSSSSLSSRETLSSDSTQTDHPGLKQNAEKISKNKSAFEHFEKVAVPFPSPLVSNIPKTVAETVSSVRRPYNYNINSPLRLVNAEDPIVLEKAVKLDSKDLIKCYLGLAKSRLTGLVVVTAMAGYALAPAPFALGSFVCLSVGTALTSASANTVNQIVEVNFDSQMDRTKNRVLVRQKLSKEHAAAFAVLSGVSGLAFLTLGANGLTAALGGLNLLLYTCIYTPLKQKSIANTWVGSVVGGIPPLMGWVACTGEISHGALLLGGILYAWQFPHFNALSWNLRNDYNKAGYKMMAISHPELCKKTSLRYSLSLILISSLAPVCSVTSWAFVIDSLPLNGYLAYLAYRFYQEGDSASSRKLFRFSLIHLPTLILLMMVSKKAYAEKKVEDCPIATAIEATATATGLGSTPPSPPIVFASSSSSSSDSIYSYSNSNSCTEQSQNIVNIGPSPGSLPPPILNNNNVILEVSPPPNAT